MSIFIRSWKSGVEIFRGFFTICFVFGFSVGCVSGSGSFSSSSQENASKSISTSPVGKDSPVAAVKTYSGLSHVHVDRFNELRGKASQNPLREAVSNDPAGQSVSGGSTNRVSATTLFVRSERWAELLNETGDEWETCTKQFSAFSESCRELGRARALAHVRLGHSSFAWKVFDAIASRSKNSQDGLFFSGLYMEAGATNLCAQLAASALQWEPAEPRLELWVIQARCLRLSGRFEEARQVVRFGLNEFRQESSLLVESAFGFFGENNLTQGCELIESLFRKDISQVAVVYNWAQCLVRRRDAVAASGVLSRGRLEWPSERVWIILAGEVALLEGRIEDARQFALDYLSSSDANDIFRVQAERLSRIVSGEK